MKKSLGVIAALVLLCFLGASRLAGTVLDAASYAVSTVQSVPGQAQAPPQAATFRLVAVAGGPRGAESGGIYRLDEVRSTFSRQRDTQVIVYFRWKGPPGKHRLAARWRGPGGAISTQSEFDYEARDREFGAYWILPLSASTPVGGWSIEATIDGLPSGSFAFEVTDAEPPPAEVRRRPLEPAQIYERALQLYAVIQRLSPLVVSGDSLGGLVAGNGIVATTFAAVDATDTLRVTLPDGSRQPAEALAAWNRRHGWALLKLRAAPPAASPITAADTPKVGDRCYSIMGEAGGARVLVEGTIIGASVSAIGPSVIVSFFSNRTLPGSPVLDEYGDLIGIMGGGWRQAVGSLLRQVAEANSEIAALGGQVIPLSALPLETLAAPVPITELRTRGVLMPPVTGDHVLSGGFARQIDTRPTVRPIDQRDDYSVREGGSIYAFVTWDPKVRLKGFVVLRLFNDENRVLVESRPLKSDFKPGDMIFTHWPLPLPSSPGVYRVDIMLDAATFWRGFFRVTE